MIKGSPKIVSGTRVMEEGVEESIEGQRNVEISVSSVERIKYPVLVKNKCSGVL